ncbi:MAG: glycosyl transferase family 90 [Myxococcaceae bacterium]
MKNRITIVWIGLLCVSCGSGKPGVEGLDTKKYTLSYEGQIKKDLAAFGTAGITRDLAKKAYEQSTHNRVYVEIKGGQLMPAMTKDTDEVRMTRIKGIYELIERASARFGNLPDMSLTFNLMDESQVHKCQSEPCEILPVFSFQKSKQYADILFPYVPPFLNIKQLHEKMRNKATPFDSKTDALVWRGTHTGGLYDENNWKTFGRSQLVLKCREMPDSCDAAFSGYAQVTENGKKAMAGEIGTKAAIPLEEMQNWKYIASYDGNGWADRFVRLLASSSAIFKQDSPFYEFFEGPVKPYEHYIPVARDSSDLEIQIKWAREHSKEVQSIIKRANDFARDELQQEHVDYYVHRLLQAYGFLQGYGEIVK